MLLSMTAFLRSRSVAPPSPRHHAFCFDLPRLPFSFFGMVVAGEVGFLLKGETDGILVLIRWTRFCQTIFWGYGFGKTETNLFLDFVRAEEGSGEESARAFLLAEIGKRKSGKTLTTMATYVRNMYRDLALC